MKYHYALPGLLCMLLAGCNTMTVQEEVLSTNQRIAMVSTPGDGVSPPTNVVLLEQTPGVYTAVGTGFGTAPIPALLTGGVAGIAVGAGLARSGDAVTQNCQAVSGTSSAFGGVSTGGVGGVVGGSTGLIAANGGASSADGGQAGAFACN